VVKSRLTKSELLSAWEEKFGPLTDSQRKVFLSRQELAELVELPRNIALGALSLGPRLADFRVGSSGSTSQQTSTAT